MPIFFFIFFNKVLTSRNYRFTESNNFNVNHRFTESNNFNVNQIFDMLNQPHFDISLTDSLTDS